MERQVLPVLYPMLRHHGRTTIVIPEKGEDGDLCFLNELVPAGDVGNAGDAHGCRMTGRCIERILTG
jgi:hypothetical protein